MSKPLNRKDKGFLHCPVHSNESCELNILCLNPSCPQKGLICYLCVFCEPHINTCSSYLTPIRLIQHGEGPCNAQDELNKKVETHLQSIETLKNKFLETINEYESKIKLTLDSFKTPKQANATTEDLLDKFNTRNFKNEEEFKASAAELMQSVRRVVDKENVQWVYSHDMAGKAEAENNTVSYLQTQKKLVEKMEDSLLLLVSEIVMTMTSEAGNYKVKTEKKKRDDQKNATGLENILEVSTDSKQMDLSVSDMKEKKLTPSMGGYQTLEDQSENNKSVSLSVKSQGKEKSYEMEKGRREERESEKVKKSAYRRVEERDEDLEEERKEENVKEEEEERYEEGDGDEEEIMEEDENEEFEKREKEIKRETEEEENNEEEKESMVQENKGGAVSEDSSRRVIEIVGNKELGHSMIRMNSSKSSFLSRNPALKVTGGRFENIECENYIYVLKRPEKRFDAVAFYSREKGICLEGFGFYCPKPIEGKEIRMEYKIFEGVHEDAKLVLSEGVQIIEPGEAEGKCEIGRIFLKNPVVLNHEKYYTLVLKYLDEVKLMYGDGKWLNVGPFVFAGITRKIVKHWLDLKYKLAESEMMHSGQFPYLIYSKVEDKKVKN